MCQRVVGTVAAARHAREHEQFLIMTELHDIFFLFYLLFQAYQQAGAYIELHTYIQMRGKLFRKIACCKGTHVRSYCEHKFIEIINQQNRKGLCGGVGRPVLVGLVLVCGGSVRSSVRCLRAQTNVHYMCDIHISTYICMKVCLCTLRDYIMYLSK